MITSRSSPTGATLMVPPGEHSTPYTPLPVPHTGEGKVTVPPVSTGISRRQLLIGGGAALLVAGGLGTWAITSRLNPSPKSPAITVARPRATPNPNAPVMALLGHAQPITSLAWSPTAMTTLASASSDDLVLLWDIQAIQQGQASPTQPKAKQQFEAGKPLLAWSPDGGSIAIGNSGIVPEANDNLYDTQAEVYTSDLGQRIPTYDAKLMTFNLTVDIRSLSWAPGQFLVSVSHPHKATGNNGPYRLEFRDPLHPQKGLLSFLQYYFAYAVATSPDGTTQAIGTGIGYLADH